MHFSEKLLKMRFKSCEFNNLFIVKSLNNILKTLKTDLNLIINNSMEYVIKNKILK